MLLTLIWGSVVVLGSYYLSGSDTNDSSGDQKKTTLRGATGSFSLDLHK